MTKYDISNWMTRTNRSNLSEIFYLYKLLVYFAEQSFLEILSSLEKHVRE